MRRSFVIVPLLAVVLFLGWGSTSSETASACWSSFSSNDGWCHQDLLGGTTHQDSGYCSGILCGAYVGYASFCVFDNAYLVCPDAYPGW